jgi:hypothetical protein
LRGLPGEGKPLEFEDDTLVPEEVRAVYRVQKNAGFVPPELEALRDAAAIDRELRESTSKDSGALRRAACEFGGASGTRTLDLRMTIPRFGTGVRLLTYSGSLVAQSA